MALDTEGDQMVGKRGGSGGVQKAKYDPGGLHGERRETISDSGVDECTEQIQRGEVPEQKPVLTPPPPPPVSVRGIGGMGHGHAMSRAAILVPPWKADKREGDGNLGGHQSLPKTDEHSETDDINSRDSKPTCTVEKPAIPQVSCVFPSPGLVLSTASPYTESRDSVTASQTQSMEVWSVLSVPSDRGREILSDPEECDDESSLFSTDQDGMSCDVTANNWEDNIRSNPDYQHPSLDPLRKAALLARESNGSSNKRLGGPRGTGAGSSVAATAGTSSDRFAAESDDVSAVTEEDVSSSVEVIADCLEEEAEYEEFEALDSLQYFNNDQSNGSTHVSSLAFHCTHFHNDEKEYGSAHWAASSGHVVKSLGSVLPPPPMDSDSIPGPPSNLFGGGGTGDDEKDDWGTEIAANVAESHSSERIGRGPSFTTMEGPSREELLYSSQQQPCSPFTEPDTTPPAAAELFGDSSCPDEPPASPSSPVGNDMKGKMSSAAALVVEENESNAVYVNDDGGVARDFNTVTESFPYLEVCNPAGGSIEAKFITTEASAHFSSPPHLSSLPNHELHRESGTGLSLHRNQPDDEEKMRQEAMYSSGVHAPFDGPTNQVFGAKSVAQSQVSGIPSSPPPPPEDRVVGQDGTTVGVEFSNARDLPVRVSPPPDHGAAPHTDAAVACPPPRVCSPPAAQDELYQGHHEVPLGTLVKKNVSADFTFASPPPLSSSVPTTYSISAVDAVSEEKKEGSTSMRAASLPAHPTPLFPTKAANVEVSPENGGDPAASATPLYVDNDGLFGSVVLPEAVPPSQPPESDEIASTLDDVNPSHVAAVHDGSDSSTAPDVLERPPFYNAFDSLSEASPEPVAIPSTEDIGGLPDGMFGSISPSDELSPPPVNNVEVDSNLDHPPPDGMPLVFDLPRDSYPSLFNSTESSPTAGCPSTVANNSHATATFRSPLPPDSKDNKTFNAVPAISPVLAYSKAGGHGYSERSAFDFDEEPPSAMAASDAVHQDVVIPQFGGGHPPGPNMFQAPPHPSVAEISAEPTEKEVGGVQNGFFHQPASAGQPLPPPHHILDPPPPLPRTQVQVQNHLAPPQYANNFNPLPPLSKEPANSQAPHHIPVDPPPPHTLPTVPNTTTSDVPISQPNIMFVASAPTAAAATALSVRMIERSTAQSNHQYHQPGPPPHAAIVSMGFGGRLVIVEPHSRTVKVWNVRHVTTLSQDIAHDIEEFPGPAEVSKLSEILRFCEKKTAGLNGEKESDRVIWGSVLISLKYSADGQQRVSAAHDHGDGNNAVMESELAALLKESQLRSSAGMRVFLSPLGNGSITPEPEDKMKFPPKTNEWVGERETNGDLFHALERHLIEGQCDEAVQLAFSHQKWGLGILIALHDKGSKSFQTAALEYVSNCIPHGYSSLSSAVLSLAGISGSERGAGPQELLNSWKLVASSYLATDDYQGKLVNFGDELLVCALTEMESGSDERRRYGMALTRAAHTLYIMAGLAPQKPGIQSRMVLPGVDFSDPLVRSFRSSESWDAMHLLEVLELIHGSELTSVALGHKLRLAMALADIGWLELADAYTNRVRMTVNSLAKSKKEKGNGKSALPYTSKFVDALSNFEERIALALGKSPPAALGEGGAGRWLLKKMTDIVKSSSNPPPQSESKYQPQQQQQPYGVQEMGGADLPAGTNANLPGPSSAAMSHHQNNGAPATQQPFGHRSPYRQYQPSNKPAVTSEAQSTLQQRYGGSPFANSQQTNPHQPQVLFHPYASPSSMPSQQQGQCSEAGGSVAAQSEEEPSLPQSQLQHPIPTFHPYARDPPTMQQPQGQTTQRLEHPREHQQRYSPPPQMELNQMYITQEDHSDQIQDVQQPVITPGQPKEIQATATTDQSMTTTGHLSRENGEFFGVAKSAPTSTQTTPLATPVVHDKKHPVSVTSSPRSAAMKRLAGSGNKKSSGFLSGLVQKLTKVVHPEATVADIGEEMQAYWDDSTQKWVFPVAPEGDSAGQEVANEKPKEAEPIPTALAALMAPPPVPAFGVGRAGAASFANANQTLPPPQPSRSTKSPVCWTPPNISGT